MRLAGRLALAAAFALIGGPMAAAQTRAAAHERFEVSFGGLWIAGAALGSNDAELRANSVTPTPFRLFTTDTRAAAAPGLDARVAYWLTPTIAVEAGFTRARPELTTRISGDAEGAAGLTVAEQIDQYFVEGGVVWVLEALRFGRTQPFVAGGAGYLRQLHEGRTLVETGQVFQIGAGIRHPLFSGAGWIRTVGARLQGRVYFLTDGIQLEDRPRTHGAVSGAIFVAF